MLWIRINADPKQDLAFRSLWSVDPDQFQILIQLIICGT
jgi:hypothetical protein